MTSTGFSRLALLTLGTVAALSLAVLLASGELGVGTASAQAQAPRELRVLAGVGQDTLGAFGYFPETVRIRAGDMVTWQINSDLVHTVSFTTGTAPEGPTRGNSFGPAGEVIPGANIPVPEGPTGVQMRNPVELFPTRAPGAPVETYRGEGYFNSGRLYREPLVPGVLGFQTFSLVFDTPGVYRYLCLVHPEGMSGTVEVLTASTRDLPDQADVDAQAQAEMAAILSLSERARAVGSTARSLPGPNDTTIWSVRAGNLQTQINDFRVQLDEFLPKDITVRSGDPVVWESINAHTVTFIPVPPAPEWHPLELGPDGVPRLLSLPVATALARPAAVYEPTQYFNSGNISGASPSGRTSFILTFERPGTFEYRCLIHGERGMVGSITVVPR